MVAVPFPERACFYCLVLFPIAALILNGWGAKRGESTLLRRICSVVCGAGLLVAVAVFALNLRLPFHRLSAGGFVDTLSPSQWSSMIFGLAFLLSIPAIRIGGSLGKLLRK